MLALRRSRCILHSVPTSQTRFLRTQPREILSYARAWDPTRHRPVRGTKPQNEPCEADETQREASEQGSSKNVHKDPHQWTDGQDIVIEISSRDPRVVHNIKRLQYLFNLANYKDELNHTLRAPLWKAYTLAKSHKGTLPKYLSQRAWSILWKSQSTDSSDVPRHRAHLAQLNRDHAWAKAPRIAAQVAYNVERQFMAGKEQEALDEWETSRFEFGTMPEYLDLGARLYGLAGKPDQARTIMEELFSKEPDWDPTVILSVFRAYTSSDLERHYRKKEARELYRSLKTAYGSRATVELYDACLVGFLEARSLVGAKEVFRDMVHGGFIASDENVLQIDEVLRRLNLLYALATNISAMTSIALDAITVLPMAYHGHVFGDWMKSAVVEKAPQAAAQILDMMIHRGYEPEAFHFNMLLRALLRTKESENVLKAENIGWKMIEEARLAMQPQRPGPQSRETAIDKKLKNVSVIDTNPAIAVPTASVSTFALIMRHHARSLQWEHVEYLARQLKLANINPNCTVMNVLIDNKCRQGKYVEAWQIYKSLTDSSDAPVTVFPDGETIRCLWKTLRIALGDPANRDNANLPKPRELLRETIDWWTKVRSRHDADRFLQGLSAADRGAITALILHCFSYTQDLAGSLVALHVLRHKFDIFPTPKVADILQRQLAWVDMSAESESVRIQFGFSKSNAKNLARVRQLYHHLKARRFEELGITPETVEEHSEEKMGDLELNVISEFVRHALLTKFPPEIVELMIDGAQRAVGVPKLPTGDRSVLDIEGL